MNKQISKRIRAPNGERYIQRMLSRGLAPTTGIWLLFETSNEAVRRCLSLLVCTSNILAFPPFPKCKNSAASEDLTCSQCSLPLSANAKIISKTEKKDQGDGNASHVDH